MMMPGPYRSVNWPKCHHGATALNKDEETAMTPIVKKIHHVAYRCKDALETARWRALDPARVRAAVARATCNA